MRFQIAAAVTLASSALSLAAPSVPYEPLEQSWEDRWGSSGHKAPAPHTSPRPPVSCHPKHPGFPFPVSPHRHKVCYVNSHGDGKDDSSYVLQALHECNNGGHAVFKEGVKYTIGTALDLTFLEHIDVGTW